MLVGGGLGRTPVIGAGDPRVRCRSEDLLSYLESDPARVQPVGRRDNKFKARIKILVNALGMDEFRRRVEEEWAYIKDGPLKVAR